MFGRILQCLVALSLAVTQTAAASPSDSVFWGNGKSGTWPGFSGPTSTAAWDAGAAFKFFADDLANLKTDIAGSTAVAADGDTVGKWLDSSGNAYHVAAAADDTTRPLYHVRSGKGYVQGDGSNDLLFSASAPGLLGASGTSAFTICMAYRWASPVGSTTAVDESDNSSTNSVGSYFRTPGATPADMLASLRGSNGSTNIVTGTFLTGPNDGTDHVVCWVRNGSTLTPYLDGTAGSTISVTSTSWVGNRINLFARYRNTTKDSFSNVQIYGVIAWQSDKSANVAGSIQTNLRALMP